MSRRTVNAHRFADREQAAISVTRFRVGRVATLPLFFLLPATRVGGLYLLIPIKFHEASLESKTDSQPKLVIGSAVAIRGTLSIAIILSPWCLIGTGSAAKKALSPVESMVDQLNVGGSSMSSFDLRSLKAKYHLHVIDDTQRT